ncbi:hypothetical protein ACFLWX_02675 [Chloroflexota bacterium]
MTSKLTYLGLRILPRRVRSLQVPGKATGGRRPRFADAKGS